MIGVFIPDPDPQHCILNCMVCNNSCFFHIRNKLTNFKNENLGDVHSGLLYVLCLNLDTDSISYCCWFFFIMSFSLRAAGAMSAMTSKGIVHRDLKPQNILLSHEGKTR
jgi:serine/threonine protein kinase